MSIGNLLRDIREKKGLTQKDTAAQLNMSASTLCKYETNQRNAPQPFYVAFAELMEIDYDWLWNQAGHPGVADSTEPYGEKKPPQPWFEILSYQEWIGLDDEELSSIKSIVEYKLANRK
ncbi:MAG: helix-turn-helix domain-containing protein [Clostridiales bacterium]|nr:helix-turn-helix domain-containing protein [Clostridiales bacterium]